MVLPVGGVNVQKVDRIDEFVTLYAQYARRVYSFIRTLVPHQADAEDVFQEVGRVLWEKFDEYESGTDFLHWAFSISHFKVLQHRRTNARRPSALSDSVFDLLDIEALESAKGADARQQALADCFQHLEAEDRALIEARYRHGESTKSVAEGAGRSIDAIYRALRRIHRLLFDCVRRRLTEETLA